MANLPLNWDTAAASFDPPETQALNAILNFGVGAKLDRVIMDGKVHRFPVDGDKNGKMSGWYRFYSDGLPAGSFGSWRGDVCAKWRAQTDKALTDAEIAELDALAERARIEHAREAERRHVLAAETARQIWNATPPADPAHPYLARKGVGPHGLRQTNDGRLVMPIFKNDAVTSLQYIGADGGKFFHSGGDVSGGYYIIKAERPAQNGRIYVAEGFATAASVAEATGAPAVVALNAGNLAKVAPTVKAALPNSEIVFVADNDENGVGKEKADAAAALIGARVIMPPEPGDANDYARAGRDLRALLEERPRRWILSGKDAYSESDPIGWLIKGWLQKDALMMMFGESGAGKTFLMLDMALTIASGTGDWHGLRAASGDVLYLNGEGQRGIKTRIAAWVASHGVELEHIHISVSACDFNRPDGYSLVASECRASNISPVLFVIDTLNRFLDGDENKADDTRTMIVNCDRLRRDFPGSSVVILHHIGVNPENKNRARGSSAWRGAMDIEIKVEAKNGRIYAVQTKNKDAEAAKPLLFEKVQIAVPGRYDEDGDPVTSLVLEPSDAEAGDDGGNSGKAKLDARTQRVYEAYDRTARVKGHLGEDGVFAGVIADDWREEFTAMFEDKYSSKRIARIVFNHGKRRLIELGEIAINGMFLLPAGENSNLCVKFYTELLSKKEEKDA